MLGAHAIVFDALYHKRELFIQTSLIAATSYSGSVLAAWLSDQTLSTIVQILLLSNALFPA